MDDLRRSSQGAVYEQKDPLVIYKQESFYLFSDMVDKVNKETISFLYKGEIPALNKLARKYSEDIQFIVVFWDVKSDAKKSARQFNNKIKVCYANEAYKNDQSVVATLKHALGFPTSYFLNANLEVIDIKRGGVAVPPRTSFKKAFEMNFNVFNERLVSFLDKKENIQRQLATTGE